MTAIEPSLAKIRAFAASRGLTGGDIALVFEAGCAVTSRFRPDLVPTYTTEEVEAQIANQPDLPAGVLRALEEPEPLTPEQSLEYHLGSIEWHARERGWQGADLELVFNAGLAVFGFLGVKT